MASVTADQLKKEIKEILKDADLTTLSAKKVRQQLEEVLNCDLTSRKKEIDTLVMEYINANEENNEDDDSEKSSAGEEDGEEEDEDEEHSEPEVKKPAKRTAAARKSTTTTTTKKRKHNSSAEEESASEDSAASDEEYSPKKTSAAKPKKKGGRRKKGSESDSDEEWKKPKKAKKAGGGGGGKGKGTGFTRAYTLSPELGALMGAESLPRHEVVKKMWAIIKERNLYDPKNKQFAICDQDLIKVIGVKRFRTFGMLKYLRQHFID